MPPLIFLSPNFTFLKPSPIHLLHSPTTPTSTPLTRPGAGTRPKSSSQLTAGAKTGSSDDSSSCYCLSFSISPRVFGLSSQLTAAVASWSRHRGVAIFFLLPALEISWASPCLLGFLQQIRPDSGLITPAELNRGATWPLSLSFTPSPDSIEAQGSSCRG